MFYRNLISATVLAIAIQIAPAQDKNPQTISLDEPSCRMAPAATNLAAFIDINTGTILTSTSALDLIALLMNSTAVNCDPPGPSYVKRQFSGLVDSPSGNAGGQSLNRAKLNSVDFIIHVVRWTDAPLQAGATQTVQQQRWYLVHKGQFVRPGRLFGTKTVYFIYLHLNKDSKVSYTSHYNFTITQTIPQNQQNLALLAQLLAQATPGESQALPAGVWGGMELDMWYSAADVAIDPSTTDDKKPGAKPVALDNTYKIHNEALEWWDVSAGVPLRKMSQLNFQSSSNTLVPQSVDKKSIFALADFYPIPQQRKDLAYSNFTWYPSLVLGLPVSQQPLHQPLFGAAWGFRFAQFYAGVIIRKQNSLSEGSILAPGTSACTGWCPQFAFGINLPVKALQSALKSKPAASGGNGNSKEGAKAPATPAN
jgi:hypothetical protein